MAREKTGVVTRVARYGRSTLGGQVISCQSRASDARGMACLKSIWSVPFCSMMRAKQSKLRNPPLDFLPVHQANRHEETLAVARS